jgi:hypothetical protein
MVRYLRNRYGIGKAPSHIWLGVSVEDAKNAVRLPVPTSEFDPISGLSGLTSAPVTEGLVVRIGKKTVRFPMKLFPEGRTVLGYCPVLLLLSGCGEATPECGSLDTHGLAGYTNVGPNRTTATTLGVRTAAATKLAR